MRPRGDTRGRRAPEPRLPTQPPLTFDRPPRGSQSLPVIRGFATAEPLTDDALHAAGPPRYPRPSRLAVAARGLARARPPRARSGSGSTRSATCSSTCRATARRRARSASWRWRRPRRWSPRCARSRSRSVRRRGMKPLVEAVVADATGTMKATFFNQPWLERKYRPGTRLLLQGKYQGRNRFRVSFHAPTGEAVGSCGRDGDLPGDRGALVDADPRPGPPVARRRVRGARAAARAAARDRAAAGPRRRARSPPTSATTRAAAAGSRSRS